MGNRRRSRLLWLWSLSSSSWHSLLGISETTPPRSSEWASSLTTALPSNMLTRRRRHANGHKDQPPDVDVGWTRDASTVRLRTAGGLTRLELAGRPADHRSSVHRLGNESRGGSGSDSAAVLHAQHIRSRLVS